MTEQTLKALFDAHSAQMREALDPANLETFYTQIEHVCEQLKEAYTNGHNVYVAGNGGSAAQAQHFSDEMLGRYRDDRVPYPAMALNTDAAAITCIGNDYGYEHVFSRQLDALGSAGDIFIGLSTSGTSKNIIAAAESARGRGMTVIALTGPVGDLKDMADYAVIAPVEKASLMQEFHLHAIHLICEAFEDASQISANFHENPTYGI